VVLCKEEIGKVGVNGRGKGRKTNKMKKAKRRKRW
jgi:hypothetical protein